MEILTVKDLTFTYPGAPAPTLSRVSLSLPRGTFALLAGPTGSGKSTLLRLLKEELAPRGKRQGTVLFRGEPHSAIGAVGFVQQDPERQIVTDKVWHELAFGLENLGLPRETVARRVAEMAEYFGIEDWFDRRTDTLSGGQKQLLNLASVMAMDPELLILDEPTSQLDPIAASEFLQTLKKLNEELSLTVLIAEHRLEEVVPLCDRLLILEEGCLTAAGKPREVIRALPESHPLFGALPAATRLCRALAAGASVEGEEPCPLTVKEGRCFLEALSAPTVTALPSPPTQKEALPALTLREVFFRYDRRSRDVLEGLSLTVRQGEIFCLLGGNGSGKTTALACAAGLLTPHEGRIEVFGKPLRAYPGRSLYQGTLSLLPQDVGTVFLHATVREELSECGADLAALPYDLTPLFDKHPYDLSGGEQQLVALAKVLATKPRLLLMDEPTKGLDADRKSRLRQVLTALKARGVTVVLVTHDVDFAAACGDRCALLFRGQAVSTDAPRPFFAGNRFYTTAVSRMTAGLLSEAVTVEEALACYRPEEVAP